MKESCTIYHHKGTFSATDDQWSSVNSSPVALPFFKHHAGGSPTRKGNLCRMHSDTSVILDPPLIGNEPFEVGEPRKLPLSKSKGVVPQPNGRWGAQIYIKHQPIWLGTFNHEKIAARAYDIAAKRHERRWEAEQAGDPEAAGGEALPPIEGPTGSMLFNFLDVNDKVWRFRYSYWNSSRSYVLSRGWTWFVKDKNLKAGNVVTFERSSGQDKQLYISFRSGEEVQSGHKCCRIRPLVLVVRLFGVDIGRIPVTGGGAVHACQVDSAT